MTVDLDRPIPDVATEGCTHLYVTAFTRGAPIGSVVVAAPIDPFPAVLLIDALESRFAGELFFQRLLRQVEEGGEMSPRPSAGVVVCTCDRPEELERCLATLTQVGGPVQEVIVIDNGRRLVAETRRVAERAGTRYVREPLPGLDRARNQGLAVINTDLVLFVDDDVEVHPDWAEQLIECFADPLVMAATGLVLPARMDTEARRRSERFASHGRGFRRRVLDGSLVPPEAGGVAGVGASMAFRTGFIRSVGGFPEELDAGMPTKSGGDTYAFYQVLKAGYRVAYQPRAVSFHWHRDSGQALVEALGGYGTGLGSFLLYAALEERDPATALSAARILVGYLGRRMLDALRGRPNAPLDLVLAELAGVLRSPAAFRRARRVVRSRDGAIALGQQRRPAPWIAGLMELDGPQVPPDLPKLSVVIPSRGRRELLVRLLRSLDGQHYPDELVEVVVCLDGDIDGSAEAVGNARLRRSPKLVMLEAPSGSPHHGNGAGVARNAGAAEATGDLLVFFDDDLLPLHDGVLLAHAAAHAAGTAAVVGPLAVDLRQAEEIFAQRVRNWWVDHARRLSGGGPLSFTDLCTGNLSLPRALFEDLGGFRSLPRREDWELGYRLREARVPIEVAPGGWMLQEADTDLANALDDRRREGAGDLLFGRLHPGALLRLPLGRWGDMWSSRRLVRLVLEHRDRLTPLITAGLRMLRLLEWAGLRRQHAKLLDLLSFVSYWSGVGDAAEGESGWLEAFAEAVAKSSRRLPVELGPEAWKRSGYDGATELEVLYRGHSLGTAALHWGGTPWAADAFAARLVGTFHDPALFTEVLGEAS